MTVLLFALAQALDAMTTYVAIGMGGQEMMAPASWLISQGWSVFLVAKILTALWILPTYAFVNWAWDPKSARWILGIAVILAWFPVVGNITQILLAGG